MKQGPRYHVKPRRYRQGRTDYRRRLQMLKSRKTRIVVRKSIKNIQVQFVIYLPEGDSVLTSVLSSDLKKQYNWKYSTSSIPAAYLTGILAGTKAKKKGIDEGILDIGRYRPTTGNKLFAVLKGVIDAGVTCPYDEAMLPSDERLLGKHIKEDFPPMVEEIKTKIMGGK